MRKLFYDVFIFVGAPPSWMPQSVTNEILQLADSMTGDSSTSTCGGSALAHISRPVDQSVFYRKVPHLHKRILPDKEKGSPVLPVVIQHGQERVKRRRFQSKYFNNLQNSGKETLAMVVTLIASSAVLGISCSKYVATQGLIKSVNSDSRCLFEIGKCNNVVRRLKGNNNSGTVKIEDLFNPRTGEFSEAEAAANYCTVVQLGSEEVGSLVCKDLDNQFKALDKTKNAWLAGLGLGVAFVVFPIFALSVISSGI
eukprot:NODE_243_length_13055_cov_0.283498.p6 type:complete len:254 gc:universal NODE_243_length_13055_cov_0.283498:3725-2964(-)